MGIYPYAPLDLLIVAPRLPAWLPEITLSNLPVGNAVGAIRFYRNAEGLSSYKILDKRGKLSKLYFSAQQHRESSAYHRDADGNPHHVVAGMTTLQTAETKQWPFHVRSQSKHPGYLLSKNRCTSK